MKKKKKVLCDTCVNFVYPGCCSIGSAVVDNGVGVKMVDARNHTIAKFPPESYNEWFETGFADDYGGYPPGAKKWVRCNCEYQSKTKKVKQ